MSKKLTYKKNKVSAIKCKKCWKCTNIFSEATLKQTEIILILICAHFSWLYGNSGPFLLVVCHITAYHVDNCTTAARQILDFFLQLHLSVRCHGNALLTLREEQAFRDERGLLCVCVCCLVQRVKWPRCLFHELDPCLLFHVPCVFSMRTDLVRVVQKALNPRCVDFRLASVSLASSQGRGKSGRSLSRPPKQVRECTQPKHRWDELQHPDLILNAQV